MFHLKVISKQNHPYEMSASDLVHLMGKEVLYHGTSFHDLKLCMINTDHRLTRLILLNNIFLGFFNVPIVFYIGITCVS